jgi:hypothetical protein
MPSLIADVGLRGAACLWQAVPKRFTRRHMTASVLLEPRLKGGGTTR